jgi:exodeoxyribonuclease VII large subunit
MNSNLLQKLKDWRRKTANSEGIEPFRVFPNKVLENIAEAKPANKEELMAIKGIRDKKFARYGKDILSLVNGISENENDTQEKTETENDKPYTISAYLNFLNAEFKKYKARVQGEVSSVDNRDGYLFFSLKDKDDGSVLSCFMWRNNYEICGISLEVGMEVIVDGFPEIHAPNGKFSFKVSIIELVGEGALKKAYDQLKKKLEAEGLFSELRKKPIPDFPQKIGLITSESGAVIHDFLNNLGKYGYHISFVNSRVEGQIAVHSLLSAIKYFDGKNLDVLVIIRGGGSLESLQAFNNEVLVRKIAEFKVPVICGIGHDKDIPLASLVADRAASTPTAVAVVLNKSWEQAANSLSAIENNLLYQYQKALDAAVRRVESLSGNLVRFFNNIFQAFDNLRHAIENNLSRIAYELKDAGKTLSLLSRSLLENLKREFENKGRMLDDMEKQLKVFDPVRQLALGYSIISIAGKVVKTVKQVGIGKELDTRVSDGTIKSIINKINQKNKYGKN